MYDGAGRSESAVSKPTVSEKMKIMLVEDDPILSALMNGLLKQWEHDVTVAGNGLECVKLLNSEDFDLVLLDLQMPVMDGFDVLRWVRTHYDLRQCQFIVLSTTQDEESVTRAFDLGADDYVSKPIEPKIFSAKLKNIVTRWRQSKINSMLLEALAHKEAQLKTRLDHERLLADKIHNVMLRGDDRLSLGGFNVASYSKAAKQVNGDFWDAYSLQPGTLDIVFGDVMGHGPLAAILAEQIKAKVLRSILDNLSADHADDIPKPCDIVNHVHQFITPKLIEIDAFITMIYLRLDHPRRRIIAVSCGHSPALKLRTSGTDELGHSQLPLGVLPTEVYQQCEHELNPGDKVFLSSDGVSEKRNKAGEFYLEQMNRMLGSFAGSEFGAGALLGAMVRDIEKFSSHSGKGDDMTLVMVEVAHNRPSIFNFSLGRDLSSTVLLREKLAAFLERNGCSKDLVFSCMMVSTEVFTNIVLHTCAERSTEQIDWKISSEDGSAVIVVEYSGVEFDPSEKLQPPVVDLETQGGLGLYMVQTLCSGIRYAYAFGVNRLVLEFSNFEGVDCGD